MDQNSERAWNLKYSRKIADERIPANTQLIGFLDLFDQRVQIMEYGAGLGGDVKLLSSRLKKRSFTLIERSEVALKFAKERYLGERDSNGNIFQYFTDVDQLAPGEKKFDLIMAFEVLEHIRNYREVFEHLWLMLNPGGIFLLSVPVRGWRDRHREHVNKFTVNSMFRFLSGYSRWVHVSPRTYSKRTKGRLSTAFFYVTKTSENTGPALCKNSSPIS